jgi:hypothetical protein
LFTLWRTTKIANMIRRVASRAMKFLPAEHHPPHEPLDIRASLLIGIQDVELTAKRPQLFDWFGRPSPAPVAKLDLNDDGSDSLSCTGRTIPK